LWFLVVVVVVVGLERRWFQNLNPSTQLLVSICCLKVRQASKLICQGLVFSYLATGGKQVLVSSSKIAL
jgi:hypothetical protein